MPGNHFKSCFYWDEDRGDDNNDGSKDRPVKSHQRCLQLVAEAKAKKEQESLDPTFHASCPGVKIVDKVKRGKMKEYPCGADDCGMCKLVNAKKRCPGCRLIISNRLKKHDVPTCGWQEDDQAKKVKKRKAVEPLQSMKTASPTNLLHGAAQNLNALTDRYGGCWFLVVRTNRGGPGGFSKCWHMGSFQNQIVTVGEDNEVDWSTEIMIPSGPESTKYQTKVAFHQLAKSFMEEMKRETGRGKTTSIPDLCQQPNTPSPNPSPGQVSETYTHFQQHHQQQLQVNAPQIATELHQQNHQHQQQQQWLQDSVMAAPQQTDPAADILSYFS